MSTRDRVIEGATSRTTRGANERLVLDMIRSVENRDFAGLAAAYHPDVEFIWPPELPYGGSFRGEEVVAMTELFAAAWGPVQRDEATRRLDPKVLGSVGDDVAVHYVQRGKDSRGRSCEAQVIGLYTVTEGLVRRLQMFYFDPRSTADFLATAEHDDQ